MTPLAHVAPALLVLAGCSRAARQEPVDPVPLSLAAPFVADTQRTVQVAPGIVHRFLYVGGGPWAIHILDVDRNACYSAVAVKGAPRAAGRRRTSELLAELDSTGRVVGGVNADFFAPDGTPTNAHISDGRVITGPNGRPVLAFDSAGTPRITPLQVSHAGSGLLEESVAIRWNRPTPNAVNYFDANWGVRTDTLSNAVELQFQRTSLAPASGAGQARRTDSLRLVGIDTTVAGMSIPSHGAVIRFAGAFRDRGLAFGIVATRGPVPALHLTLAPFHPREAVGGRPVLVRDSSVAPAVDTEGGAGFATSRHPRTAVGMANGGRRLLLVTVDGRQKPYSDGMTLRELADLMRALGAREAINLDGGGSTAMVVKSPATRSLSVVSRPSDAAGERAVGNGLAIVRDCRAGPP